MSVLSTNAQRLLTALRLNGASHKTRAITDKRLSEIMGIPDRHIIDAAGELLRAGVLCLANGEGRFITEDIAEAKRYERSLRSRALKVLMRRRDLRAAIRTAERKQSPDSTGQLALFGGAKR